MIIDATLFHNEFDMLDVRLNYLEDIVDKFFIVESSYTFTGMYKGFKLRDYLCQVWPSLSTKIEVYENSEYLNIENYRENLMADDSVFVEHLDRLVKSLNGNDNINTWLNDFYQRELIKKLNPLISKEDLVFISDIDEIFDKRVFHKIQHEKINFFSQDYFKFSINFKQNILWRKAYCCKWKEVMRLGVNGARNSFKEGDPNIHLLEDAGWHFTSFGRSKDFLLKLKSWGHQEYNTFLGRLMAKFRFMRGMDPFGSGEILVYSEPNLDNEILNILKANYEFKFIQPSGLEKALHYFITCIEKFYRKIILKV